MREVFADLKALWAKHKGGFELAPRLRRGAIAAWEKLGTRSGMTFAGIGLVTVAFGIADYATLPPALPGYAQVRAAWHPSEAWL